MEWIRLLLQQQPIRLSRGLRALQRALLSGERLGGRVSTTTRCARGIAMRLQSSRERHHYLPSQQRQDDVLLVLRRGPTATLSGDGRGERDDGLLHRLGHVWNLRTELGTSGLLEPRL